MRNHSGHLLILITTALTGPLSSSYASAADGIAVACQDVDSFNYGRVTLASTTAGDKITFVASASRIFQQISRSDLQGFFAVRALRVEFDKQDCQVSEANPLLVWCRAASLNRRVPFEITNIDGAVTTLTASYFAVNIEHVQRHAQWGESDEIEVNISLGYDDDFGRDGREAAFGLVRFDTPLCSAR